MTRHVFGSTQAAYDSLIAKCSRDPHFDNNTECLILHSGDYEIEGRICSVVIYRTEHDDKDHIVFVPLAGYDGKKHLRAA
jgi:hypothetical protein